VGVRKQRNSMKIKRIIHRYFVDSLLTGIQQRVSTAQVVDLHLGMMV
jgi:hypothetical protein